MWCPKRNQRIQLEVCLSKKVCKEPEKYLWYTEKVLTICNYGSEEKKGKAKTSENPPKR